MLLKHSVCHCLDVCMMCACVQNSVASSSKLKNVSCQCNKQDMHHTSRTEIFE